MKLFINIRRMVEKYCKTKGRFWNFSQNKQRQSNGKQIFLSIVSDLRRTEMVWNEGSSKLCYGNGGTGDRNVLAVRNNVLEEIQISFLENFLWFILSPYYNPPTKWYKWYKRDEYGGPDKSHDKPRSAAWPEEIVNNQMQ